MARAVETMSDVPLASSLPSDAAPLESILRTEELHRRPSRLPDHEKENRALPGLASALADSPRTFFETLAETILDLTRCDSAGVSLLTRDGLTPNPSGERFYWPAIAGRWNPYVGGGTPRHLGPWGDALDQDRALLFTHFERRYSYLRRLLPAAEECLVVPVHVAGRPVGTIWAVMHDGGKFDAEDVRIMASLARFAASAYRVTTHLEDLEREVSEHGTAEAEVRQRERWLESRICRLVEANVVGIAIWNREGAITDANDAFLRMVQYDREDLAAGRVRWPDLNPPEWRQHDEQARAETDATGAFQPFEKECFRRDGSRLPVLVGGASFDGSGADGVIIVLDLSEQKRTERALRRSEAFLARGQRLSQMGSYSWRPATDEITWSEELYRIFGLESGAPVTLETFRRRIHPEDIGLVDLLLEQARSSAIVSAKSAMPIPVEFEWQCRVIMPDRSIKHVHAITSANPVGDGQLEYLGAVHDITARRQSEDALDQARAQLSHLARVTSLALLTASIAHEISQPLAGIVTNASTCLRMLDADPQNIEGARATARRTIRDANRASDVITRLRALYSRKELTFEPLDLNEVTREVIALSLSDLQRNRVALQTDLAVDLPAISGDRIQLQQVILNLLRNASDAMAGVLNRPRHLLVKTEREHGDRVRVSVRDSGVGIDPEVTNKLFDAFYTTKSDGMGIGLSISRSIIDEHGGRLWAQSNEGPGATFSFSIPTGSESAHRGDTGARQP